MSERLNLPEPIAAYFGADARLRCARSGGRIDQICEVSRVIPLAMAETERGDDAPGSPLRQAQPPRTP
jgi:hypothetical protein